MKNLVLTFIIGLFSLVSQAITDTSKSEVYEYPASMEVQVKYLDRYPFFYNQGKELVGIEKEILHAFTQWAQEKKGVALTFRYKNYKDFPQFYEACKQAKTRFIGAGTVTMNAERAQYFDFSGPYLKNISVLVSAGWVPSNLDVTAYANQGLRAATTANSVHEQYLKDLSKNGTVLSMEYIKEQQALPKYIKEDSTLIGYMDVLNYWSYVKSNPDTYIKIHRDANRNNEAFGFISNKDEMVGRLMEEFFESGFGFTATKQYRDILEKYLGYEVIEAVEVNPW